MESLHYLALLPCFLSQGLLYSHDKLASKQMAAPVGGSTEADDEREYLYERASQYGEESIKIVRIKKTADPLVSGQ